MTELSIIIVSYNARSVLEGCLASIETHPPTASTEIVVVDNASTDGSLATARQHQSVRTIESDINRGFAAANNSGIRASSGRNLLLLNSDTVVTAGAIDGLLNALRTHPEAAVVGPRLVGADGRPELSFGPMLTPIAEMRQRRLVRGNERGDEAMRARVDAMTRREQWPDWVSGACLLVSRADAESVGLLDERYFMYTEDVDFCASLRAKGRRIFFTPSVEIVHLVGRSAASAPAATRAAYERSHLAFYQKHHPLLAPFVRLYRGL